MQPVEVKIERYQSRKGAGRSRCEPSIILEVIFYG